MTYFDQNTDLDPSQQCVTNLLVRYTGFRNEENCFTKSLGKKGDMGLELTAVSVLDVNPVASRYPSCCPVKSPLAPHYRF